MAKVSDSVVVMKKFIDDLYALNPDVLPPKEMVLDLSLTVTAGQVPTATITIVGLTLPTLTDDAD